ncbi:NAD(+)/NADH kinase [Atopobium fossor]|uniref:NAD(+)/NADH kinase n=1 Tax=Atopobium fossor TaxID=39487 RepID=UPI00041477E7|nr:NAD(+)/NADH kinase [Atopobium fossor]
MKVLLVPNYSRPVAVEAASEISNWLEAQGIEVSWAHDKKKYPTCVTSAQGSDLVVSLGGDGTLLRAANIVSYAEIPLLGLSFGHLGFLTAGDSENVVGSVASALAGEMHVSRRTALDVELHMTDKETGEAEVTHYFALNELAVTRGADGDMIEFDVEVSGHHIDRLRGDGVVVSTATGSTGYALAAGGPIVHPDFKGMLITPIAPHTILARSFMTGASDVVEIATSHDRPADRSAFVDGQLANRGKAVELACVRRGPGDIVLLDGGPSSFYNSVSRVFYGRTRK